MYVFGPFHSGCHMLFNFSGFFARGLAVRVGNCRMHLLAVIHGWHFLTCQQTFQEKQICFRQILLAVSRRLEHLYLWSGLVLIFGDRNYFGVTVSSKCVEILEKQKSHASRPGRVQLYLDFVYVFCCCCCFCFVFFFFY